MSNEQFSAGKILDKVLPLNHPNQEIRVKGTPRRAHMLSQGIPATRNWQDKDRVVEGLINDGVVTAIFMCREDTGDLTVYAVRNHMARKVSISSTGSYMLSDDNVEVSLGELGFGQSSRPTRFGGHQVDTYGMLLIEGALDFRTPSYRPAQAQPFRDQSISLSSSTEAASLTQETLAEKVERELNTHKGKNISQEKVSRAMLKIGETLIKATGLPDEVGKFLLGQQDVSQVINFALGLLNFKGALIAQMVVSAVQDYLADKAADIIMEKVSGKPRQHGPSRRQLLVIGGIVGLASSVGFAILDKDARESLAYWFRHELGSPTIYTIDGIPSKAIQKEVPGMIDQAPLMNPDAIIPSQPLVDTPGFKRISSLPQPLQDAIAVDYIPEVSIGVAGDPLAAAQPAVFSQAEDNPNALDLRFVQPASDVPKVTVQFLVDPTRIPTVAAGKQLFLRVSQILPEDSDKQLVFSIWNCDPTSKNTNNNADSQPRQTIYNTSDPMEIPIVGHPTGFAFHIETAQIALGAPENNKHGVRLEFIVK